MAYMSTNTGGGTPTKAQDADANTKVQVEESADENKIRFDTAGSERMIIDDTGQVGIGTSGPGFPLDIKDDTEIASWTDVSEAVVNIESTSDGQIYGPTLKLYRNSPTSADSDRIGMIRFTANAYSGFGANSGPTQEHEYARIYGQVNDVTGSTEDGTLHLESILAGQNVGRLSIGQSITINGNTQNSDFVVHGQSVYALVVDASANSVGIGTNSPAAKLDLSTGGTFRNTRLLTVAVSANTALTEADHAGRYNICAGHVALPATSTAGEHYAILNTTGGNITIFANTNNINGASGDFTLGSFKAATCIAIGSNDWMVVG